MFVELSGAVSVLVPARLDGGGDCETTKTDAIPISILIVVLMVC